MNTADKTACETPGCFNIADGSKLCNQCLGGKPPLERGPENATPVNPQRQSFGELIIAHRRWWEYTCNTVFALFCAVFMFAMLADFLAKHRASSLLLCIFEGGIAWFAVTRPMPKETNVSLYDWCIGVVGALSPLLLRPAGEPHDHILLLGAQLIGQLIYVTALFSLNRSFGVVAANRGIKTGGLYRVVRHPVYAGLILSNGAYVLQNMSVMNAAIYLTFVVLSLMRIVEEERVLCRDQDYAGYVRRTPWRVLPLIY
jgi:protein-S-isoprenylcysteine O-methyltransferase Ste14